MPSARASAESSEAEARAAWERINRDVIDCERCPRLREHCRRIAEHPRASFRGETHLIDDLCDDEPLPFGRAGVLGFEVFPDALRFQKNLMRECPQTCIH